MKIRTVKFDRVLSAYVPFNVSVSYMADDSILIVEFPIPHRKLDILEIKYTMKFYGYNRVYANYTERKSGTYTMVFERKFITE